MFWLAILASIALTALVIFDAIRGRTRFGRRALVRLESPATYWGVLAIYLSGAIGLFLLAGVIAAQEMGCDPNAEKCTIKLVIPQ